MADIPYVPPCNPPSALGLIDIKIASPAFIDDLSGGFDYGTILDLGTATDSIEIQNRPFFHDIHSDRNGGRQGPMTDTQFIGEIVTIGMELTTWNTEAIEALYERAVNATAGTITQDEVGSMMLAERSVRLLLNNVDPAKALNYWCCLVREPIAIAVGTKWASYRLSFTAYRPPCYHAKAGILWDRDISDGVVV